MSTQSNSTPETVPENEQGILSSLIEIRDDLTALKQDRSKYLQSKDVNDLYRRVVDELKQLVQIRSNPELMDEQNRVDTVLADVFQLLSLSFLTVGLNRSLPASYASLNAVKRLLDQMAEGLATFTAADVTHIRQRLEAIKQMVNEGDEDAPEYLHSPEMVAMIQAKLKLCEERLITVEKNLVTVDAPVEEYYNKLVMAKREIMSIGVRDNVTEKSFASVSKEVVEIAEKLQSMQQSDPSVNIDPAIALVDVCQTLIKDFSSAETNVNLLDKELQPIFKTLVEVKQNLENLMMTRRWTLRETDLYSYQHKLQTCEKELKRIRSENEQPVGYLIILYLMRRCYAIVYKLLESSEPVSEALTPLHNQLTTVRRCLLDVQRVGGVSKLREVYPYQMKLASIDNMRVDGKFMVGKTIPEGQGMLNALLAECFDICNELKEQCEE